MATILLALAVACGSADPAENSPTVASATAATESPTLSTKPLTTPANPLSTQPTLVITPTASSSPTTSADSSSLPTLEMSATIPEATQVPTKTISLSISLYLLVDNEEQPDPEISTHRTKRGLREILEGMNDIWSQAGIRLELEAVEFVEIPEAMLRGMLAGNLGPFLRELGGDIPLPKASTIIGFYLRNVGGPNGINPSRTRTFFVIDEPSVFDRRVSSHEVGHILGLHHVLGDPGRLLFSGTNGMTLTENEATVARYFAQGIIQGVR